MHPNPRRMAPVLLLVILAALGIWYFWIRPASAEGGALSASGTIEIIQVHVGAELGGKVIAVRVAEGDTVKTGDILVEIDAALLEAQRAQAAASMEIAKANAAAAQANAEAAVAAQSAAEAAQVAAQAASDAAQANLDLVTAGATAEQLQAAAAQADQAQASYQAAQAGYAALTSGARPEEVNAARSRLDWARRAYYELTVTFDAEQIAELTKVVTETEMATQNTQKRLADLRAEGDTPEAIIQAMQTDAAERAAALSAAQMALAAAQEPRRPCYQQMESAQQSLYAALLVLAQSQARQEALQDLDGLSDTVKDALQAAVDDAQKSADAAQVAYDALDNSKQVDQLRAAWSEVQAALLGLNRLARGSTTALETVLNQLDAAAAGERAVSLSYQNLSNGARPEQIAASQAQLNAAQANLQAAQAQVEAARSKTIAAQAQAEAAQAQVKAAQAALDILEVQIGKLVVRAPTDGVVLSRVIEPGEIAAPGAMLLSLGRLEEQTITVYIPEDRYGEISLGQAAEVKVDSFPDLVFQATVVNIAATAEFTPRNVQTVAGRKNTVFAIKLHLDNADGKLKAGMPADVVFLAPGQ